MDFRLEHDLNRYAGHHPALDWMARHVAESQYWVVGLLLVIGALGLFWRRRSLWLGAGCAIVAAGLALLGNVIVSRLIWTRDRPFVTHPRLVHLIVHHPPDASFPSDHSAALAGIACAFYFFDRRFAALFAVWAVAVGVARVYVGEHYPGDILGGWLIGIVAGVAVGLLAPVVARRAPALLARGH